jgi:hypothetical protein
MARLKAVKQGLTMLVVDFDKQLEPGSPSSTPKRRFFRFGDAVSI